MSDPIRPILPSPVSKLIGFQQVAAEGGRAVYEMQVESQHLNPTGTLHGGILCDIADEAMGAALMSTVEASETMTTLELKINFLKPVRNSRLRVEAHVVKRGRTVSLVEAEVFDEGESLVAKASSTCMILRGEMAKGR